MDVIGDLVARDRRSDALAVRRDTRAGSYSYEKLCTNAWKTGNILRHYGVRRGATVAIVGDDPLSPPPLLAFLGAALLGATARFDPPAADPVEAEALVVPTARLERYDPAPGSTAFGYGDAPSDPTVAHFEGEVWSENPAVPPAEVGPGDAALAARDKTYTHADLLERARAVAVEFDLDEGDAVALRAPLSHPGTVAAGVLAPLVAGATILLDRSATGTVGVSTDGGPEERIVDPAGVL
ncbi:MAG: acetyl-CoA synthetase [Haloarculaceae archaeon]